jgi:Family of unknown function (DUF6866) N-terminal domain/Family of unknown function (DUF6866) C-terminal domain
MDIESSTQQELLQEILPAIRGNCAISDATHSGLYSLCGLFLRLKDHFLWEQGLAPWDPLPQERLLSWIDQREALWTRCSQTPLESITIKNRTYDYLDSRRINHILMPLGLYYGAGYGRGMKPHFFLGQVREVFLFSGYSVIVLDKEYACDLFPAPALRQSRTIVLRLEPMRFFFWGKIQETEQFEREATRQALNYYGWDPSLPPEGQLERIALAELEPILHHEIGEASDRTLPSRVGQRIFSLYPHSRIELYFRSLKDLLGDTHPKGTLTFIISNQRKGSLAFYVSNLRGITRLLFPEIISAFQQFKKQEDWKVVDEARRKGRRRMVQSGKRIRQLFAESGPEKSLSFSRVFEKEFMKPLGL